MKKFIQYTAVLGAVLTVLGFGTASAAHVYGGRWSQMEIWKINNWKERIYPVSIVEDTGTVLDAETVSFLCVPIFSIEVDFGNVIISPGDTEEIFVRCAAETDADQAVRAYVEDGEMNLVVCGKKTDNRKPDVYVTVPEGYCFEEIDIELRSGSCTMEGVKAVEFLGEAAGGDLLVENGEASWVGFNCTGGSIFWNGKTSADVAVDCAAGSVVYQGQIFGDVAADCAAGNIYLELLWQQETDFNYALEGVGGNIQVGNNSFSGMAFSKKSDHGASKSMDLQSAGGSIQVEFGDMETTVEELPFSEIDVEEVELEKDREERRR